MPEKLLISGIALGIVCLCAARSNAQPQSPDSKTTPASASALEIPRSAIPLNPDKTLFLDKAQRKLLLKTSVCLREGVLEMFICPKQTKEHESVLAWAGQAQIAHAGLLALGAQAGHPVRFHPEYSPPTGETIEIFVNWKDSDGQQRRMRAQQWVRHATYRYFEAPLEKVPNGVKLGEGDETLRYDDVGQMLLYFGTMTPAVKKKFLAMSPDEKYQQAVDSLFKQGEYRELEATFVFTGSHFQRRDDGTEVYLANAGSLVCVANFSDAMIDVNIKSTASNDAGLLFEPWTERIPPLGTEVLVELIPAPAK